MIYLIHYHKRPPNSENGVELLGSDGYGPTFSRAEEKKKTERDLIQNWKPCYFHKMQGISALSFSPAFTLDNEDPRNIKRTTLEP